MEGDASTWAALRLLNPVARPTAWRMAGASAARRRTAPSQLKAVRTFVRGMVEAGDASTRAAPRLLLAEAHRIVWRMEAASAVRRSTASN